MKSWKNCVYNNQNVMRTFWNNLYRLELCISFLICIVFIVDDLECVLNNDACLRTSIVCLFDFLFYKF